MVIVVWFDSISSKINLGLAAKVNKGLSVFKMEDPKWKDLMELPDGCCFNMLY